MLNARASIGLIHSKALLAILWIAAAMNIVFLISQELWFQSFYAKIGLGTALGGALGNFVDQIRWKAVIDFIDFKFWPTFNVADIAIVAGWG
jgi:signal peptidase II